MTTITVVFAALSLYVLGIFLAHPWIVTKLENLEDEGSFREFSDDFLDDVRGFMAGLAATFWLVIALCWGAISVYGWFRSLRADHHEH
jgi:hypothetical protein